MLGMPVRQVAGRSHAPGVNLPSSLAVNQPATWRYLVGMPLLGKSNPQNRAPAVANDGSRNPQNPPGRTAGVTDKRFTDQIFCQEMSRCR